LRLALLITLTLMVVSMASCSSSDLVLQKQTTGLETNCHLLYDPATREAAIIDVGGPVEELLATIREKDLTLKYFLLTHGHSDHLIGLPAIRDDFPDALVCMHEDAFADLLTEREWAMENLGEEVLAEWSEDPEFRKIVEFDVGTFGEPDVLLEEGHTLRLGAHEVRALLCPGHARGSICYAVDGMLFSGDVLFKGSVGRVDVQNSSREDQIASVRRLYAEFPDETVVYPGHGEPTTIGAERTGNERITETAVYL
jgi:hydroxyacylglutathione hydrolase